jgi:hypothetical protein
MSSRSPTSLKKSDFYLDHLWCGEAIDNIVVLLRAKALNENGDAGM